LQCISTGWKCDFPPVILARPRHLQMYKSQSLPPESCLLLLQQPSTIPHIGRLEICHFQYFRNVCTKEFSLYFEVELYEKVILLAAYAEPCIMHAVLAIGALIRCQNAAHGSQTPSIQLLGSAAEYPTEQYNLAIRTLNRRLDSSTASWELAVLGSLVSSALKCFKDTTIEPGCISAVHCNLENAPQLPNW
jgi:hypothetical protein